MAYYTPGSQPKLGPVLAGMLHDGIEDFERKPGPDLDRTAVHVDALVACVLEELVDEIAVRAEDLDAVEACAKHRAEGGCGVPVYVLLDICLRSVSI